MKKIFAILALAAMTLTASAQGLKTFSLLSYFNIFT